jgi:hypothetical protein
VSIKHCLGRFIHGRFLQVLGACSLDGELLEHRRRQLERRGV